MTRSATKLATNAGGFCRCSTADAAMTWAFPSRRRARYRSSGDAAEPILVCKLILTPLAGQQVKSPILHYLVKGQEIEVFLKPIAGGSHSGSCRSSDPHAGRHPACRPRTHQHRNVRSRIWRPQRDPPISVRQRHNAAFSSHCAVASVHRGQARFCEFCQLLVRKPTILGGRRANLSLLSAFMWAVEAAGASKPHADIAYRRSSTACRIGRGRTGGLRFRYRHVRHGCRRVGRTQKHFL